MTEYHKINSIFKRDMQSKKKQLIVGDWASYEFEYLANNEWVFSEKIDGTNIRIIIAGGAINFGGRTDNAQIPTPLLQRLQERFLCRKEELLSQFPNGAVFYGEGYGGKIQNGGYYRQDQDFILFDVLIGDYWLHRPNIEGIATKYGLNIVPIIGTGSLHDAVHLAQQGIRSAICDWESEGIVARPKVELRSRAGERIIAKIKCRDFIKDEALAS